MCVCFFVLNSIFCFPVLIHPCFKYAPHIKKGYITPTAVQECDGVYVHAYSFLLFLEFYNIFPLLSVSPGVENSSEAPAGVCGVL